VKTNVDITQSLITLFPNNFNDYAFQSVDAERTDDGNFRNNSSTLCYISTWNNLHCSVLLVNDIFVDS